MKLKLGSRTSNLALWQSRRVASEIEAAHEHISVDIVGMETTGDRRGDVPLPSIGAKGLFTAELEQALLEDRIDLAVHSLKDLPSTLPEGLKFAGSLERANPTDAFISTRWNGVDELPDGAQVATGSQRRRAQLLHRFPSLKLVNLRGNIETRLQKLEDQGHDGIIMATAALHRLAIDDHITEALDPSEFVPAVAQGAIGVETRVGRDDIDELLAPIWHRPTVEAVRAERHFMRRLDGGCSVALGGYCRPRSEGGWSFHGWASSTDGQQVIKQTTHGDDPTSLAKTMAQSFVERGAQDILHS